MASMNCSMRLSSKTVNYLKAAGGGSAVAGLRRLVGAMQVLETVRELAPDTSVLDALKRAEWAEKDR